jgi:hypothetical protein
MRDDDDDTQDYVPATGWRKRQSNEIIDKIRNDTLEEVAKEFDQMKAFGTTAESFACYVRDMKVKP